MFPAISNFFTKDAMDKRTDALIREIEGRLTMYSLMSEGRAH